DIIKLLPSQTGSNWKVNIDLKHSKLSSETIAQFLSILIPGPFIFSASSAYSGSNCISFTDHYSPTSPRPITVLTETGLSSARDRGALVNSVSKVYSSS